MARQKFWYSYWCMDDRKHPGMLLNCVLGPKNSYEEMVDEVAHIYRGPANFVELETHSLDTAKGILRNKIAQMNHDAQQAMQRFRIKSIPHQSQYEPT
jgi:hypothetical protein